MQGPLIKSPGSSIRILYTVTFAHSETKWGGGGQPSLVDFVIYF